jgi:NodT family efflux transporter outer membrane factor (OMF) lipoprotein
MATLSQFQIKNFLFTGVALFAMFAPGCVSIPPNEPTPLPTPESYSLDTSVATALSSQDFKHGDWPRDDWWQMFGDVQLDRLVDEALAGNPDIKIAAARVRLAQQAAAAAHAGNLPQVDADASITREHFSENWIIPPPFAGNSSNEGQISLNANYDLDLWNRNANLYQARLGEVKAAAATQAETRLVISTTLARAYFQLQGHVARLDIAHAALAQRVTLAKLVESRADEGLETLVAVKQVDADVAREQANVIALDRAVDVDRRAIAALVGKGPDIANSISAPASHFDGAFPVPEILPMDLLARRPDVTAQSWRTQAAAHQVGVARAGFYPNINIAAALGLQSLEIKDLFRSGSKFSTYGPAIHLPIFEGGRLRANLGAAYAEYDMAVEEYRRALVNAAREVADQLAAVRSIAQEQERHQQALRDSEEAYRIAQLRYERGITDYLTVLLVERDVLQQRDVNTQLAEVRLEAMLGLIKALGGGYRSPDAPTQPATDQEKARHG